MAARVFSPKHDQHTRDKIQTSQLVNRLNSFALDTTDSVRMTSDQVRAALGLLKKTIPDLAVTSHTGPDGGPVLIVTGVERGSAPDPTRDDEADPPRGFTD
jgi:hypothetical protein